MIKKMIKKINNWYWFKFKIKNNEFHHSMDYDISKLSKLSKEEQEKEVLGMIKKKNLAHELDTKNI